MSHRIEKVNSQIQKIVGEIIAKNLSLKEGVFLTVSKVDTSADLRYTRVFISVFPFQENRYAKKTLEKEIFSIQGAMNKQLQMKILPKIEFILDERQEKLDEIDKIFGQIEKENHEK